MRPLALALGALTLLLAGCHAAENDLPPPPRKAEIAIAPPHALGALAAGTDAAPHPDMTPPLGEVEPDVPAPSPSGSAPQGGGPAPGAPPATPDAGMAL